MLIQILVYSYFSARKLNFLAIIKVEIFIENAFTWIGSRPAILTLYINFQLLKIHQLRFGKYVYASLFLKSFHLKLVKFYSYKNLLNGQ